ncbi:helicase-related protein [Rhodocytophaga aerolata]|uniref:Helicase-related protein n=1 Tax=Rhodocytophaga aerolata TaxID=455078 RepID=A0ABT8REL1_9BACT|nr:helicase-related protein [Rhodocytophaga aerolata]MDO1450542.1 helicase-related protein [Rhodocytophaga aerolata]
MLTKLIQQLQRYEDKDSKYFKLHELLTGGFPKDRTPWFKYGYIIFSQYFDTIWDMAELLSKGLPIHEIGIYAGGGKAGILLNGIFTIRTKEEIKRLVQVGRLKVLFSTDAASVGLNLQRLRTLINIDLPWNPTRLEQRKGRIQGIGQVHDVVYIYNMRYKYSVEDQVHDLISSRLEQIHQLFGQIPDVLEDACVGFPKLKLHESINTIVVKAVNCGKVANFSTIHSSRAI